MKIKLKKLNDVQELAERFLQRRPRLALFLPIGLLVLWTLPYIYTWNKVAQKPEDSDYFFQAYEAIRRSILHYHQFPWMNAWVGGGVPLFANPQVGVLTPQTGLVLLFGTVAGLKLSVVLYSIVGYFGAFKLFKDNFKTSSLNAILLGLCWVFNGFFVGHLFDHYSFLVFILFPLGLYLQINILKKRYWLYYGLFLALLALSAVHYALIEILLVLALTALLQFANKYVQKSSVKTTAYALVASLVVMLVLAGFRLLYTLEYVLEFPKMYVEPANSVKVLFLSLLTPSVNANIVKGAYLKTQYYGAMEYSAYIGWVIFCLLLICLVLFLVKTYKYYAVAKNLVGYKPSKKMVLLLVALVLTLLMALGRYSHWSPFALLSHLPGFSNMRIPSRWLLWTGFVTLCIIGYTSVDIKKNYKGLFSLVLVFATLELFLIGFWYPRGEFTRNPVMFRSSSAPFLQYERFTPDIQTGQKLNEVRSSSRKTPWGPYYAYESTRNNIGELYGYEPVYSTQADTQGRCGVNAGCPFVSSKNATVTSWTPNEIILKRTGDGPIVINMAPSNYWLVNGKRYAIEHKIVGPGQFIISDPAGMIHLSVKPKPILEILSR